MESDKAAREGEKAAKPAAETKEAAKPDAETEAANIALEAAKQEAEKKEQQATARVTELEEKLKAKETELEEKLKNLEAEKHDAEAKEKKATVRVFQLEEKLKQAGPAAVDAGSVAVDAASDTGSKSSSIKPEVSAPNDRIHMMIPELEGSDSEEESEEGSEGSDSEGAEFNKIMSAPFAGVSLFVAATKKTPNEKLAENEPLNFDFDDGPDNEAPDETMTATATRHKFSILDTTTASVSKLSLKYTKLHVNCKDRLFNLLDVEKPEKALTLGQLREIMTGCVQGKKEKDAKCRAEGLPTVTMESYLFEFLEQRYNSGDTQEIKEWFVALSRAVNKFGVFDVEICIFGKQLRNLLAESFPDHQRVLRNTAEKMLKEELSPAVWNSRMYNGIPLKTFEKVVCHMFNAKDGADIIKRVKDPLPKVGKRAQANLEALSREYVRYMFAMEILMTFNMNLQDDFLADFIVAFRKVDMIKDGCLNSNELNDLVQRFGSPETVKEGSSAYTLLVDAKASTLRNIRRFRRLTFSEAVDQFTDLLSARWTTTGKKGTRYQCHEMLKTHLAKVCDADQQPEKSGHDALKGALKKLTQPDPKEEKNKPKSSLKGSSSKDKSVTIS